MTERSNPKATPTSLQRQAIAPAYLFACLLLGGSAQGIWANLLLQLIGLLIIGWAAMTPAEEELTRPARQLLAIVLTALILVALQLIPLPASIWSHLGGRAAIAAGYQELGMPVPAVPISLSPYASFATLVTTIPALAMICAMVRLKAYRPSLLALALLAGAFSGIVLGALQVASGDPQTSPWYLYDFTNFGFAVGFFANANHMAILLVIAVPFLAAILASSSSGSVQRYSATVALTAGGALLIIVGIVLNQSLAGYGLAIPVFAASLLIATRGRTVARQSIAFGSLALLLAAVLTLAVSPIGTRGLGAMGSVQSRETINATTFRAVVDFLPFGSGLGTFKSVYKLYESHEDPIVTVINHAHNDFAELALETGLPGIAVIIVFLIWWAGGVRRVWRAPQTESYARAASLASAALIAHSLVDFPLRTPALSACFAMCLGLLVEQRRRSASEQADLWRTRHLVIG